MYALFALWADDTARTTLANLLIVNWLIGSKTTKSCINLAVFWQAIIQAPNFYHAYHGRSCCVGCLKAMLAGPEPGQSKEYKHTYTVTNRRVMAAML
eukprot:scaffold160082_cov16-Prasinocladus_malaysianus.AAC.1